MKYFNFLKQKIYFGLLIVLGCAMLGSVLGARKESKEPLNEVIQEDILIMQQADGNAPELIGILPLATNQNKWYNFKYAFIFAGVGIIFYCALMLVYMHVYYLRFFRFMRKCMGSEEGKNNLFIKL